MKEIHTKKEFLDSLQPRLENILKVKKICDEEMKCTERRKLPLVPCRNASFFHACSVPSVHERHP